MALVQFATRINFSTARMACRQLSSKTVTENVKKSVFISQSTDVFTNLALEDWLYRNFDFNNHHILMVSHNDPSVVIGKHQNPWSETNMPELAHITNSGVQVARRNCNGPAVYHDQGNLNMTFFTPANKSNQGHDLEMLTRALFRNYGIEVKSMANNVMSVRHLKVSENSAKVGRTNAYHQCTLFVNVDKVDRTLALQQTISGIQSSGPQSEHSKIFNLCEEYPKICTAGVLRAIGWEYLRTPVNSLKDGGQDLASKQNGFQMINPTERWFPGITELRNKFSSWDWCFAKTPKFTVTKTFSVSQEFMNGSGDLRVTMVVEHGRISDITVQIPSGLSTGFSGTANAITSLKYQKFSEDAINALQQSICGSGYGLLDDKDKFGTDCVRQVMTSM
ncbi:hypothetical protein PPYR_06286 [Photinus pyralis]|uniref:BPL/LPL catalytic domain-containing protein n=1 Tax=Photinus pyralis TaxID=7054 RepID=A0A1Y1MZG0_PHOPY|nr:lipoyltransferase 1, mitochondrial-like [Photinus pyralis]KAB0800546.1 hypothetical protein PPYR_06286 [Photinus pyralis]